MTLDVDVTIMMIRDLEERFMAGDQEAALAIEMFCYRIATTIASYIVPLGGWVMCPALNPTTIKHRDFKVGCCCFHWRNWREVFYQES